MNAAADGRRDDPPPGSSLALLRIPFLFSQDELLTTDGFITKAKERGHDIDLDLLQKLHEHRLRLPLCRVSDTPVEGRRIHVEANGGANARGWVLLAAAEGRLRDPADEGYSIAWPYRMPTDERPDRWWKGFVYSSWQLFDVRHVIDEYRIMLNPVVIGKGTPLFKNVKDQINLKLLNTRTFGNGNVLLTYEPAGKGS